MSEIKEYWILTQAGTLPILVYKNKQDVDDIISIIKRGNEPDSIHVVEYSALEAEKQLCDSLAEALGSTLAYGYANQYNLKSTDELENGFVHAEVAIWRIQVDALSKYNQARGEVDEIF